MDRNGEGMGKGTRSKDGEEIGDGGQRRGWRGGGGRKPVTLGLDFPATSRKDRVLGPGLYSV
jgi:hypothetical protein